MSADPAGAAPVPDKSSPIQSDQVTVGQEVVAWASRQLDVSRETSVVEGEFTVDYEKVTGRTSPRVWTRPLRPLTREASYGYRVIEWAAERGYPLDPWERWCAVHAGELLPDGRPRFRRVVIIVARQNGKTLLLKILILYWAYEESQRMIMMTSTNLDYAREALFDTAEMAGAEPNMPKGIRRMDGIARPELRQANGQERITAPVRRRDPEDAESPRIGGGTFKIGTASRTGGRSLPIDRAVVDELREHRSWDGYNAIKHAQNAIKDAQAFFISNKGDSDAIVLNGLRRTALEGKDRRIGLFEWSAPPDARPDDVEALRYANPNLGHRIDVESIMGDAITAIQEGGAALAQFKTEIMCIDVPNLTPAIDLDAWRECAGPGGMDKLRTRVATCLDVAPDGRHATLAAAAVGADGIVRVELVRTWTSTHQLRRSLPVTVKRVRPRVMGWFPNGPAAAVAADLAAPKQRRSQAWPPPGVTIQEIKTETPAVCMGFEEIVRARGLMHPSDEVMTMHVTDSQREYHGPVWVFARRISDGEAATPIDATYATAGAVHLARLLPEAPKVRRLVVAPR